MVNFSLLTDDELAQICRNGGEEPWAELMTRYLSVIENCAAQNFNVSPSETDDLISDGVFYGLCNAVKHFDPEKSSFAVFAKRCINNAMLNTVQKRNAQKRIPQPLIVPLDTENPVYESGDLQAQLEIREQLEEIQAAMDKILTDRERQVFILHIKGYTYAEIAEKFGITKKSAESAASRAGSKLKASFKKKGD